MPRHRSYLQRGPKWAEDRMPLTTPNYHIPTMLSRLAQQRAGAPAALLRKRMLSGPRATIETLTVVSRQLQRQQQRSLISAPKPGDGPLMERRPDRELPSMPAFSLSLFPSIY